MQVRQECDGGAIEQGGRRRRADHAVPRGGGMPRLRGEGQGDELRQAAGRPDAYHGAHAEVGEAPQE